jgi:hypothetical protein
MYEKGIIDFSDNILELTFHEVVEYSFRAFHMHSNQV